MRPTDIRRDTDDRVTCAECAHYTPGRWHCGNHRRAGLGTAIVGPALAALPQRCAGFKPRPDRDQTETDRDLTD